MKQVYTNWAWPVSISVMLHVAVVMLYLHQPQHPAPERPDTLLVEMQSISAKPAAPPVRKAQAEIRSKAELEKPPVPEPAATSLAPATPQPVPVANTATTSETVQSPPSAAAPNIQPLSKLTRPPAFLRKIDPVYPASEQRSGSQAFVLAEITLDGEGKLLDVKILKSAGSQFDEAVKEAIRQSAFQPGYIESKPVAVRVQIPFRFKLK